MRGIFRLHPPSSPSSPFLLDPQRKRIPRRVIAHLPLIDADSKLRHLAGMEEVMDLKGAVALVTGGNGGLGQRICHALAKEAVNVAVMYAKSRDQAETVARDLASRYQVAAAAFACDVTDGDAVAALPEQVTRRF